MYKGLGIGTSSCLIDRVLSGELVTVSIIHVITCILGQSVQYVRVCEFILEKLSFVSPDRT
jgi:hypothetical protein